MKEPSSPDRLVEILEALQNEGNLSDAEVSELESLLTENEEFREFYVLSQELHTMLGVDKSIRLQLASDLLPDNVIPLPGVEVSPGATTGRPREKKRLIPVSHASKSVFRTATSLAAMIAGVFVLLWMYARVSELSFYPTVVKNSDRISFHDEVLPILSDHCFECHGADENSREGDLRLDDANHAFERENPVIVRGNPEASELIARVSSTDPDYLMPPPEKKECLSSSEIEILTKWISQGADFGSGWSFEQTGPMDWAATCLGE